ncbi:MAG: hypothetical protein AABP62_09430 [Planctomycetota bacterium]
MAEDDWKQIQESAEQTREAERRKWDSYFDREPNPATWRLATKICCIGLVTPVVIALAWKFASFKPYSALPNRLAALIFVATGFALIYAPLGAACGFVAHRLCRNSSVSERHMAVALALLVVASAFGWLLWLLLVLP